MPSPAFDPKRTGFRIGVHTSIAGRISKSVERAAALNCTTMQIFSHNPRQWEKSPINHEEAKRFAMLRKKYDIRPVFIHASYLINLASLSDIILRKSIELLSYELFTADALGVEYVILHPGSAGGEDTEKARNRAFKAIVKAVSTRKYRASLLLENTAGKKGDITSSVHELAEMVNRCSCERIGGICIDTCHAFSSGYDLSSEAGADRLISEINENIGLYKLRLIHLNDSRRPLGAGVDRHEHIGKGFIGAKGFKNLLLDKRIASVPLILETPKDTEKDDKRNLRKVFDILARHAGN